MAKTLPRGAIAQLRTARFSITGPIHSMDLSPDEAMLAVAGDDGVVVWDVRTSREMARFSHEKYSCGQVLFGPTKSALILRYPGFLRIVTMGKSSQRDISLPTPTGLARLAYHPSTSRIACLSTEPGLPYDAWKLTVWDAQTWRELYRMAMRLDLGGRVPLLFTTDGSHLLIGGTLNGGIVIVDLQRQKVIARWAVHSRHVLDFDFSATGERLVSIDESGEVALWRFPSRSLVKRITWRGPKTSTTETRVRFVYRDQVLVCRGWYGIELHDADSLGKEQAIIAGNVSAIAVSRGLRRLVAYSDAASIRTFDVVRRAPGEEPILSGIGFATFLKPQELLVGDERGRVVDWRWQEGRLLTKSFGGEIAAISGDGSLVAVGGSEKVRVFKTASGDKVAAFPITGRALTLALSSDGRYLGVGLLSGARAGDKVVLYDLIGKKKLWTRRGFDCTFSPNDHLMAVMTVTKESAASIGSDWPFEDTLLTLYSLPEGKLVKKELVQGVSMSCLFTPDSRYLVVVQSDGIIRTMVARTLEEVSVMAGKFESGTSLAISHKGDLLAVGERDGAMALWNLKGRRVVARHRAHTGWVTALDFSPDDKLLVSGGEDAAVIIWDVAKLVRHRRRCLR
jgi:WD40 repeat protein